MELGGKFGFSNLLRSNLEESKEVNAVLKDEFPQQEDVKLYSQLPDYDDFRGYDLGVDEQLGGCEANFREFPQAILASAETPFICPQNTEKAV